MFTIFYTVNMSSLDLKRRWFCLHLNHIKKREKLYDNINYVGLKQDRDPTVLLRSSSKHLRFQVEGADH